MEEGEKWNSRVRIMIRNWGNSTRGKYRMMKNKKKNKSMKKNNKIKKRRRKIPE